MTYSIDQFTEDVQTNGIVGAIQILLVEADEVRSLALEAFADLQRRVLLLEGEPAPELDPEPVPEDSEPEEPTSEELPFPEEPSEIV